MSVRYWHHLFLWFFVALHRRPHLPGFLSRLHRGTRHHLVDRGRMEVRRGRRVINRNSHTTIETLVLGLGNVIMGDEGIGVHVVRALEQHPLPAECRMPRRRHRRIHSAGAAAERRPHHPHRCHRRRESHRHRDAHHAALLARLSADAYRARHRREGSARRVLHAERRVAMWCCTRSRSIPSSRSRWSCQTPCSKAADEAVKRILAELEAWPNENKQ